MRYWGWKIYTLWLISAFVFVLTLANCVEATLVCDECRPIALQEGPGVGLSLSPGHGAAAVQFANGTILDIGIIEATEAYVQAIKDWAHAPPFLAVQPKLTGRSLLSRLLSHLGLRKPLFPQYQTPESLMPLVEMVRALWQKIEASIQLEHKRLYISVPDFVSRNDSLGRYVRPLVDSAGLQALRYSSLYTTCLSSLYDIDHCIDETPECESYHGRHIGSVLSIHLDKWSMSLRSMIREDGMFYPDLGTTKLIWRETGTELKEEIKEFMNTNTDLVSLSGPEASQLYTTIKQLFNDDAKIVPEDYIRSAEDHAFAAARGAATRARIGMCNDFTACIPRFPWCPISDHCRDSFYLSPIEPKAEL